MIVVHIYYKKKHQLERESFGSESALIFCSQALILKLKDPDPNPGVVISVLATIGELAQVRLSAQFCFKMNLAHRF